MQRRAIRAEEKQMLEIYGVPDSADSYLEYLVFEKGEKLFRQGDDFPYLLFLLKGKAKVSITVGNGRTLLLCFYKDRGIMGDIELMAGCPSNSTVEALSRMECAGIHAGRYGSELKKDLVFMNYIGKSLAEKLDESSISHAWNQLIPLDERLCAYILMTEEQGVFLQNLTQTAELLGTSYRHLMRTLNSLCEDGILCRQGVGIYYIKRSDILRERAKDHYIEK